MIIFRNYDEERKLDRVWYDSSNIFYSECEDNDISPKKVLRVVFKNGATYEYSDVDVNDYVMFIAGGTDNSNGKALNEFVKKKKCPYQRTDSLNKEQLINEMQELKELRNKKRLEEAQSEEIANEDINTNK